MKMNRINEIWKYIPNSNNLYQVSNLGRVKSLKYGKERILKNCKNSSAYFVVLLSIDKVQKSFMVHQLVAMSFLNHAPNGVKIVVDHINNDKLDNRLENLQLITHRENTSKDKKNGTSKYIGVSWNIKSNKWHSCITFNGKLLSLGYFECELAAAKAYQDKLKTIKQKI